MVKATGGLVLPILMLPNVVKGWYRTIAKPSPTKSISYLQSMIKEVQVEEIAIKKTWLEIFEEIPLKKVSDSDGENKILRDKGIELDKELIEIFDLVKKIASKT